MASAMYWPDMSCSQRALVTRGLPDIVAHNAAARARSPRSINRRAMAGSEIIIKKANVDDEVLRKSGVKFITLEGKVRDAYINTIYDAKWAETDNVAKTGKVKPIIDYDKLKGLMYSKPSS